MKSFLPICLVSFASFIFPFTPPVSPQHGNTPLRLLQTMPLPGVKGRLDHMDVDVAGKRLFLSALENGSMEVFDLQSGKWMRSIPGFKKPQGIAYITSLNKIFVASGDDGMVRVFNSVNFALLDSIQLDLGPNRFVYDPRTQLLYVGYGGKDAGKDYGEVAIIDAKSDKKIGDIRVAAHPSELLLNSAGSALFVLLPATSKIQVADTKTGRVVSTWPVASQRPGSAALDEANHRLLIGTHAPPEMIAMDSQTGKEVAALPTVEGMDGVYFDANRKCIYISGGRGTDIGSVCVYQQKDADHYSQIAQIPTRPGAGTSFWSPGLNRYYVAAPAGANEPATILVFEPEQK